MTKIYSKLFFILLLVTACEDSTLDPEVQKDITIDDVKMELEKRKVNKPRSRQSSMDLIWEQGHYRNISLGDALVFPVANVDHLYVQGAEDAPLLPVSSTSFAFAYKVEGETQLELLQPVPTASTAKFTGFIAVWDWNGEIKRIFNYENGEFTGEGQNTANGRTEECTLITTYFECTEVSIPDLDLSYTSCNNVGSEVSCIFATDPFGPEVNDYVSDDPNTDDQAGGPGSPIDNSNSLCPHPVEPLIMVPCDDNLELEEAKLWEQEICKKTNFASNDCVSGIWEVMKQHDVGFETLKRFLGSKPLAELCLDIKNIGDANGNAARSGNSVTINLNSTKLNRSKLSIVRTLLHEMIHAELISMIIEVGRYDDLQAYAQNYQGEEPFKIIWQYYDEHKTYLENVRPGWQHEYMADNYIDYIAQGLKELHPFLSSQGFINYRTGSFVGNSQDIWSWDDFFIAMAWEGLEKTTTYQSEVVDKDLREIYDFYVSTAKQESSTNKCN